MPNTVISRSYLDQKLKKYPTKDHFDAVASRFEEKNKLFEETHERFESTFKAINKKLDWLMEKFDWMIGEYKKHDEELKLTSGKLSDHEDRPETVEKKLKIYAN
jgi:predicted  nucleic acid-binding Zn-ribbon protein